MQKTGYWGKYREIILAVAMFLVLDLSVLVLNFYISFQISEDALAINLAGRQRMLSQRISKSLLLAQNEINQEQSAGKALEELSTTIALFDETLNAFETGGTVTGGDGQPVQLSAVSLPAGKKLILEAREIWTPLSQMNSKLTSMRGSPDTLYQIDQMVRYAQSSNLKLLSLMNQLTTELEKRANGKANTLRLIQTIGILLALLNFAFILLKFIRRLSDSDRAIEAAHTETQEILSTVKEGLLLLDRNLHIGSQNSASLSGILGMPIPSGADFSAIIRTLVSPDIHANACDYMELLFSDHVKEGLMGDLNPLVKIPVNIRNARGVIEQRYLTFEFNRVRKDGKTLHLLVTIFDLTNEVELSHALNEAREESRLEIEGLISMLKVDPAQLRSFIAQSEVTLLSINDELRSMPDESSPRPVDFRRTVDAAFRKIHTFKGDSALLGLEIFETLAQKFESILSKLRNQPAIKGEDMLTLPFHLEEILQRIAMVKDMMQKLSAYHDAFSDELISDKFSENLGQLAMRIATDHEKKVKVITDLHLMKELPQHVLKELKEITVQLLRNAIVHGIEQSDDRIKSGKQATGNIHIALHSGSDGMYEFSILDDGRGLSPTRIRNALLRSGKYTLPQLAELDEKQILMKILEPGFTTSTTPDKHSGHGVGLDVVSKKIEKLGAQLRIATQRDTYTKFSIQFPS